MTVIKLCGLREPEEIALVNELRPDKVGFMLYDKSKRYCPKERLVALKAQLDPAIAAVGVAVNAAPQELAALVAQGLLDELQLHGQEDEAYLEQLRQLLAAPGSKPVTISQAFSIKSSADLERALKSSADCLLLDAGSGGSGKCFDWSLLTPELRAQLKARPWLLAGGLNPNNVATAIQHLAPYGVDVSSGIEEPEGSGHKSLALMRAFCAAVRAADGVALAADGVALAADGVALAADGAALAADGAAFHAADSDMCC